MNQGDIPLINMPVGPGSQSNAEDSVVLDYMPMPKEMHTYDIPMLPEAELLESCPETLELLDKLQQQLDAYTPERAVISLGLEKLSEAGLDLINQILGEGEVSLICKTDDQDCLEVHAQETVLAGVWRLRYLNADSHLIKETLEIADVPSVARRYGFSQATPLAVEAAQWPAGILNAPPVLIELQHKSECYQPGDEPHVINLSLLPFSPADHQLLDHYLGSGSLVVLSRGYGNCRISSTGVCPIWRVQYFNSTDQLILDTLEVVEMPAVVCAAPEDLQDSALRLQEIREVLI
ncbi:hydrogenase expression/formation protein [Amphritea pacifica]|uniref:Hydrogenase expression/formation protein n=1 Tax=Amphritea pacifica TaxID=2811233 RepID=A0ABS2W2R9_9GAMM|nr:hydrogenase expression/formation protein [Amphritea pacifica]MBN0986011.1 hydrogenase expression/formation protein [Amphritea pacifica]MBN1006791.1 hydrogenase expression/formation protein [Amphritea pacifica]